MRWRELQKRFRQAARSSFPIKASPRAKPAKERISSFRCARVFSSESLPRTRSGVDARSNHVKTKRWSLCLIQSEPWLQTALGRVDCRRIEPAAELKQRRHEPVF